MNSLEAYEVREIEVQDIEACLNIYNYYIKNTNVSFEEEELTLEVFVSRVNNIKKNYPYIVITNKDKTVLGYAYLDYFSPRASYRHTADLSIYLSKDRLHEHLGGILLDKIFCLAKQYGITNIISVVTDKNDISKRFHLAKGFVEEGHLQHIANKFGEDLGILYYRKVVE